VSVTIEGLAEAQRRFSLLTQKMQREVLRTALRAAARPVMHEAKARVAVDTGQLRSDIAISVSVKQATNAEALIGFRKRSYYGQFVELGTSKMPGRPFLRPALDSAGDEAVQVLGRELVEQIDRVASRAGL